MDTLHVMCSKGIASLFRFCFTELGNMSVVNQRLRLMPLVRNAGDGTKGLHYRHAGVGLGEGERKQERESGEEGEGEGEGEGGGGEVGGGGGEGE